MAALKLGGLTTWAQEEGGAGGREPPRDDATIEEIQDYFLNKQQVDDPGRAGWFHQLARGFHPLHTDHCLM